MAIPFLAAMGALLRGGASAARTLRTVARWERRLDGGGGAPSPLAIQISAKVHGLDDLRRQLRDLPNKLRRQILRNSLAAGARLVRDEARQSAPVLSRAGALKAPFRKPGTLRRSIHVRTSKAARKAGDVGVFVNVKPAKPGQRGAKSPNDPYYWRWVNFGFSPRGPAAKKAGIRGKPRRDRRGIIRTVPGVHFLEAGVRKLQDALQVFVAKAGPAIQKLNDRKN